ncbi:MAG TPA: rhomboid family intramembrane serine protease [Sphingomonas sp.]|nr:rhomboid family intramembrane serine protease [Sphingomonas sp.]
MPNLPEGRVTQGIAAATAIAFLLLWLAGWLEAASYQAGFIPARLATNAGPPGALPVWLTPLTATFVHAGLLHLGFNLMMYIFCGRFVESVIGGVPSLLLYIVGAYAAALAQWAVAPLSAVPMVGASGAISATVGAYAVFFSRSRVRGIGPFSPFVVRVVWLAAGWVFVQSLIGLAAIGGGQIAIAAHIGGFIAGLVLARPLLLWRYRNA